MPIVRACQRVCRSLPPITEFPRGLPSVFAESQRLSHSHMEKGAHDTARNTRRCQRQLPEIPPLDRCNRSRARQETPSTHCRTLLNHDTPEMAVEEMLIYIDYRRRAAAIQVLQH